jgi:hypothetical protein
MFKSLQQTNPWLGGYCSVTIPCHDAPVMHVTHVIALGFASLSRFLQGKWKPMRVIEHAAVGITKTNYFCLLLKAPNFAIINFLLTSAAVKRITITKVENYTSSMFGGSQ